MVRSSATPERWRVFVVGLCGVLGGRGCDIEPIVDGLRIRGTEEVSRTTAGSVDIAYVDHPSLFSNQPVRVNDVTRLWLWGDVVGYDEQGTQHTVPASSSGPEFIAAMIRTHGRAALAGINGDFVGILHDEAADTVSFVTDRLSTRPLYYTRTDDGAFVFSALLQTLNHHPNVSLTFDRSFVSEFLHYHRALGIYTPVSGVYQLPPATMLTLKDTGAFENRWTYWWPVPRPRRTTFSSAVDRFARTIIQAVADRVDSGPSGLFLSGGLDSRLLLAALDNDVVAFHFNEQLDGNREAELAKRAADRDNVEFVFLRRSLDHYPSVLSATGPITNFNGYFRVANHVGFEETIDTHVSHVFNGQYSDTLIGPTYVPMDGDAPRPITDSDAYVDAFDAGEMGGHANDVPFVTNLPSARSVLREHLTVDSDVIRNHGVAYPSWDAMVQFGMIYPITNVRSYIWYETQVHSFPTRYPFLDNRLIDLVLELPVEYRYQCDLVAAALDRLDRRLADLETIRHHPAVFYARQMPVRTLLSDALCLLGIKDGVVSASDPESHLRPLSGFPNTAGLVRAHPFIGDLLENERAAIDASDFLDGATLEACYHDHLSGANYTDRLFGVASLLQSSIDPTLEQGSELATVDRFPITPG